MSKRLMLSVALCAVLIGASVVSSGAQAGPPAGTQFILTGVLVVEGGGRAWLQEPKLTQNEIVSIRTGDKIGPYRLTKVLDDRVEMQGPGGPFIVRLAGGPSTAKAAAPKPASPPVAASSAPVPITNENTMLPIPWNLKGDPGPPTDFGSLLQGTRPK